MREAQSARMTARMADPALRAKISETTRDAMAAPGRHELAALRRAWLAARPTVRRQFLDLILSPVCSASANDGGAA